LRQFTQAHIRSFATISAALILAMLVTLGATLAKHPLRKVTVIVTPSKLATVRMLPGNHQCSVRCVARYRSGTRVRVSVATLKGATFERWGGACAGRTVCSIKLLRNRRIVARFAPAEPLSSWSPHVACTAILTSLPTIIGTKTGSNGGGVESGGAFQPHLRGNAQRHLLNPPCSVAGEPSFVEVDGVVVGADWEHVASDGDYTGTLADASRPDIKNAYLKAVHAEIDGTWTRAGVAPPMLPPAGTKIDVQGFVYWDPGHANERFHNFSGWELHPVSAWRPSPGGNDPVHALAAIFPAGAMAPAGARVDADAAG
jgi:hypothetical protein